MQLIELTEPDRARYNQFVMDQPSGTFLQSWEWGQWLEQDGKKAFRFFIEDKQGLPVLAAQFIKMPLPGGEYYLYAPYGPVVEGRLKIEDLRFKIILQELRGRFPKAIFIRIEPIMQIPELPAIAKKTVNIQPGITMVVDVGKSDDELLAAMHHKTRYNIKVAERHGVEIQKELVAVPQHGIYIQEAVDLILQTQARQKYRGHSARYYHELIDFFTLRNKGSVHVEIYKALYQKRLLVSAIMVDFGPTRMYVYGGSSEEDRNVMAPYLLHWTAMRDAREAGMRHYDLGGGEVSGGGEKGFTRFKQGFGGRVVEYAGAHDFIIRPLWYNSYRLFRSVNRIIKHINF